MLGRVTSSSGAAVLQPSIIQAIRTYIEVYNWCLKAGIRLNQYGACNMEILSLLANLGGFQYLQGLVFYDFQGSLLEPINLLKSWM